MSEWQPISTAPKDGTPILVFPGLLGHPIVAAWERPAKHPPRGRVGNWSDNFGFWRVVLTNKATPYIPTHWMPLPPPPKDIK